MHWREKKKILKSNGNKHNAREVIPDKQDEARWAHLNNLKSSCFEVSVLCLRGETSISES